MPRPPSCLSPPLLLLLFLLHHASSAAFLTLPLPLQQHRSSSPSSIIASPASSSPTHSPYSSQNLVVVVVNEKITRFYHHLLLPPFSSLNPPVATFTHVQPPDPYNFEVRFNSRDGAHVHTYSNTHTISHTRVHKFLLQQHDGRGHPRDRGKYQGSSYSHSTHIGQPQSKPGRSSHWPGQDHYFRTIEQQIGDAEEVLVVGHGKVNFLL